MSDGPAPLAEGDELFPGYVVVEHLRRGRNLDAYDVWSEERACRCVVKTVRPDSDDSRAGRRLVTEGRLLQRLSHPHIVRAYETRLEPRPMVVLETLNGETLGYLIEERGRRLPARDLAYLGLQLCSALGYLHRHGVLHLDVKPSNIIAQCGQAKLLDLSVARRPGRAPPGVGTNAYMSPEQRRGGVLTAAADVWGIGVVLYEAATGRLPGSGGRDADADAAWEPVRRARRLPPTLAAALDAARSADPPRRPTVEGLGAMLNEAVTELGADGLRARPGDDSAPR